MVNFKWFFSNISVSHRFPRCLSMISPDSLLLSNIRSLLVKRLKNTQWSFKMIEPEVEIWMHLYPNPINTKSIESKWKSPGVTDPARKCQRYEDGQGRHKDRNLLVLQNPSERFWLAQKEGIIKGLFLSWWAWMRREGIHSHGAKGWENGRLWARGYRVCPLKCEQPTSQRHRRKNLISNGKQAQKPKSMQTFGNLNLSCKTGSILSFPFLNHIFSSFRITDGHVWFISKNPLKTVIFDRKPLWHWIASMWLIPFIWAHYALPSFKQHMPKCWGQTCFL